VPKTCRVIKPINVEFSAPVDFIHKQLNTRLIEKYVWMRFLNLMVLNKEPLQETVLGAHRDAFC